MAANFSSIVAGLLGTLCCPFLLLPTEAQANTYYLSAKSGNDQNEGRTPQKAWRSLARVQTLKLSPGDQVVLAEGEEFVGSLRLSKDDVGTPEHPIVIRSAGKRPATILSPKQTAISVDGGGIEIRNLILRGNATAAKKGHNGISFLAPGTNGERYPHVRVSNLMIHDFGDAGISIGSDDAKKSGFDDLQISNVRIKGVYGTGIITFDKGNDRKTGYAHRNMVVRDCDVSNNLGGSGIILSGVERGLVEFCRASGNTGPGGGVGMWAWETKNVRFRYCIASGTRTKGKDGGGFDLDGACIDCVVENCLSYDNDGPGYMHCDYPTAWRTSGNLIRSSISINDGRYPEKPNSFGFGFVTWGSGLDNCHIIGNLAILTGSSPHESGGGALFVNYLPNYQGKDDILHVRDCTATNNMAIVSARGVAFVWSDLPNASGKDVQFTGNRYTTRGNVSPFFMWNEHKYPSLEEWRVATHQESEPLNPSQTAFPPEVGADKYYLKDPRALPKFVLMQWLTKNGSKR